MLGRRLTVLGLAAVLAALPLTKSISAPQTIQPAVPNVDAPELVLQDLDGKQQRLSDYKGKVVAVNFWATWCPPCRKELPSMQHTYHALHNDGLEILAVNVGENWDTVAPFLENFDIKFPVLLDQDSNAIERWKVLGLPTTFLIDENGRITHRINGGRDWDDADFRRELKKIIVNN